MNSLSFFNPRFTSDLFDVIDRNLGDYTNAANKQLMNPKVDILETANAYILDMDLPGLTEKDLDLNLKDRILTISSVQKEKKDTKEEGEWLIKERCEACFSRKFTLPDDIDADNVSAEFEKGVLTITIPRKPEPKSKEITIKIK